MDRRRRILGLALTVLLVALTGNAAAACAGMTAESCCCAMMDAAPCRELSDKAETSKSARDATLPTREAGPAAILDTPAPLPGVDEDGTAEPATALTFADGSSPPIYLRHCSLLN